MSDRPLSEILRHVVLLFEGTSPVIPAGPARLPRELTESGRGDVMAWIEGLDEETARTLSDSVWEHAVVAFPVVSPAPASDEGGSLWGAAGGYALWLSGTRRALHALARRRGTGSAGAALERAPELPREPRPRLHLKGGELDLTRTRIMGILNVTPDSFSDGGRHPSVADAVRHGERMVEEGADVIDVGGESTRPGAAPIPEQEELERVVPVIEALAQRVSVPISVDTSRAAVAREALAHGARVVNDVSGLRRDPALAAVVAAADAALILMHSRGTPQDMLERAHYANPLVDVARELTQAAARALGAGVAPDRLLIDPGLGFAKTGDQNVELLRHLRALLSLGFPLVVGSSRKKFLGTLTGVEKPEERLLPSAVAAAVSASRGAHLVRVHDVEATRQALAVIEALERV